MSSGEKKGGFKWLMLTGELEVEGGCRVQDHFDAGDLDDFVKGRGLRDVGDDGDGKFFGGLGGVGGTDRGGLGFGADGGDDVVALGEELLEDVGWLVGGLGRGEGGLGMKGMGGVPAMKPEPPGSV